MKKWFLLPTAVLTLALAFSLRGHRASAIPEENLKVTMSITAMAGIHSDWHRNVSISYKGRRIGKKLYQDTGWWRGSNLYRHTSGAYVVHEGQGWCFGFTLEPLQFNKALEKNCVKGQGTEENPNGYSLYYRDLIYMGHFYETWRDEEGIRIRYSPAGQNPEVELPDGP